MSSHCSVQVLGRLTRDPELKYTQSGKAVVNIGLAINDRVKRGDSYVEEPTFLDVTIWEKQAETANEFLRKGSQVLVTGRLKQESWEKDGQKRSKIVVYADRLVLCGDKVQRQDQGGQPPDATSREGQIEKDHGKLPF